MSEINAVCVYCGSSFGSEPVYAETAEALGRALAEAGIRLVYGGGSVGLMGTVARATLAAGGAVTGIIPQFLVDREIMLPEVTDLVVTADMHERKRIMFERSDAFVALPGGIGTLEELVEQITWAQLGRHEKPIVLADINGFWAPFVDLLEHMRATGFVRRDMDIRFAVADTVEDVIPVIRRTAAPRSVHAPAVETIERL
jgi:hypothetical protein